MMLCIEERKRLQDKLVLLNEIELKKVDDYIEQLIERRRKMADIVRGGE